jgi:hypothetical protein
MGITEKEPFYDCPRYAKCNVNKCPLHPKYPELITDPEDEEMKCDLAKSIRVRIAADFPDILKFNGLSPREYSAKSRWENMSPEEQREIKERGAKQLKKLSDIQGTSEHKGENTYLSDQPQNGKISIPAH